MSKSEYDVARSQAVLLERPRPGRIRLRGSDALDFLHRTTTAELTHLAPGRLATTVIQTETARVIDELTVLNDAGEILLLTGPDRESADLEWLERMIVMDDVAVESETASTVMFDLVGPRAASILDTFGSGAAKWAPGVFLKFAFGGMSITLLRRSSAAVASHAVIAPSSMAMPLREALAKAGAVPVGADVEESLRLEMAIPLSGRELTADTNPLEAHLHDSIGLAKGCFPGQEVIARMITYKSLKRTLASFRLARPVDGPAPGTSWPLVDGGTMAGRLTSAAHSYRDDATLGLGFLKLELAEPGKRVTFAAPDGPLEAEILTLPRPGH